MNLSLRRFPKKSQHKKFMLKLSNSFNLKNSTTLAQPIDTRIPPSFSMNRMDQLIH